MSRTPMRLGSCERLCRATVMAVWKALDNNSKKYPRREVSFRGLLLTQVSLIVHYS